MGGVFSLDILSEVHKSLNSYIPSEVYINQLLLYLSYLIALSRSFHLFSDSMFVPGIGAIDEFATNSRNGGLKNVPEIVIIINGISWKSHATLTLLAKQDCPLWLQYD